MNENDDDRRELDPIEEDATEEAKGEDPGVEEEDKDEPIVPEAPPEPEKEDDIDPDEAEEEAKADATMEETALPDNGATSFTHSQEHPGVQSNPRDTTPDEGTAARADKVQSAALYVRFINEGNFLDIGAELRRQEKSGSGSRQWMETASAVLAIDGASFFHKSRCGLLITGEGRTLSTQAAIEQIKQVLLSQQGVPTSVVPSMISWDALSFKVPPNAAELFCFRNPQFVAKIDSNAFDMLMKAETMMRQVIIEQCAIQRQRAGTHRDPFVSDLSVFLEQKVCGTSDPDRARRIGRYGRGVMLNYVDKSQVVFVTGNLPSTIAPAKIYACHDIVSAAELRGSINKLATTQIAQVAIELPNTAVRNRAFMQQNREAGSQWNPVQSASIAMKRRADDLSRAAFATLGDRYGQPMTDQVNKIAGGANSLTQQIELAEQQQVVTLNLEQSELAKQQLSTLLACLRMRGQATMKATAELCSSEDLDHFEIVKYLAHSNSEDDGTGQDGLFQIATALQAQFEQGVNPARFEKVTLSPQAMDAIDYVVEGSLDTYLAGVPLFDQDKMEGGQLRGLLLNCFYKSLVQRQRIAVELLERTTRRLA